jgi:hypothetical protein
MAALVLFALAQVQGPLPPRAPRDFVAPAARVHVRAHEDLEPDRLRELARPGVVLWLATRSNTLRASTIENVARFDVAWVQLRAPLAPVDARVFSRLPHAGAWVAAGDLGLETRLPGARRVAVELSGAFDEAAIERLQRVKPAELRWTPAGTVSLLEWSLFAQLSGRRVVVSRPDQLLPVRCDRRGAGEPAQEVHIASLLSLSADAFPCTLGTRVVVQPHVERWLLQSIVTRDPSAEVVVEVGASSLLALATRELLDQLGIGPAR